MRRKYFNLDGQRFGKLVAIRQGSRIAGQVDLIRYMKARGARTDDLSHAFGVCRTTVNRVVAGSAWSAM